MVEVSTSVLGVKEEECVKVFYNLEAGHTDYFHIDVMDGKFVEKDTKDKMLKYAELIKHISNLPLDVHFMTENIKENIDLYIPLQPKIMTFHIEATNTKEEVLELITYIKENNCKVGISIKPNTKIEDIYEYLPYIHLVLIMTVEPGKGGQELIPETLGKISKLRKYVDTHDLAIEIEADGGINYASMDDVKKTGVDIIVAGSAIIGAMDYRSVIDGLKE